MFSPFTSHLALVRRALDARGIAYEYPDGSTPAKARERHVRAFQEGRAPLFLVSLKAGGSGSTSRPRPTSSTSIRGGTPPSRIRPPIARTASNRRGQ